MHLRSAHEALTSRRYDLDRMQSSLGFLYGADCYWHLLD
jgi:hypothetical protein